MASADYEFSRPNPLDTEEALGHIMLTGRADIAALAIRPEEATAEEVQACVDRVADTMPTEEREAYLNSVAAAFPQFNQRY